VPHQGNDLPTTRPSDFPEADLRPALIRCREHANLRPKPNGPLIRDYVRDGVYKDEGVVKDRVLLSGVFDAACGPEFG